MVALEGALRALTVPLLRGVRLGAYLSASGRLASSWEARGASRKGSRALGAPHPLAPVEAESPSAFFNGAASSELAAEQESFPAARLANLAAPLRPRRLVRHLDPRRIRKAERKREKRGHVWRKLRSPVRSTFTGTVTPTRP
jgi:hypothetical protein